MNGRQMQGHLRLRPALKIQKLLPENRVVEECPLRHDPIVANTYARPGIQRIKLLQSATLQQSKNGLAAQAAEGISVD
jgi:hypothetical protein